VASVLRKWHELRARLLGRVEPVILMYHRVADLACDPWNLAITPERFAEQLETLTRQRTIVPLDWLVEKLESGHIPEKTVAITFDDGYVDVLRNAKPVLERFGASATAYLTTGAIGRRREFWWDTLSRILFESPALPRSLELQIAGYTQKWSVEPGRNRGDLPRAPPCWPSSSTGPARHRRRDRETARSILMKPASSLRATSSRSAHTRSRTRRFRCCPMTASVAK
jgi:peptidoglycan/xylan/chitin deacetylase (PgdA/CDA1 family)